MSYPLSRAQAEIRGLLAQSPSPEHARHAEDTLVWVMRLKPDVDAALALAALAHDIECIDDLARTARQEFDSYDEYKTAHALRAARILRDILRRCTVNDAVARRACRLVEMHEFGGDADADVLRDADSLSYFSVNMPLYFDRQGRIETLRRSRWDYARMSVRARRYFTGIRHRDPRLNRILREAAVSASA